ncbi:hypothetical protein GE09DRAFT_1085605 [Coniochaeta sp. 2T2.1]|nr:hypothetical protein GE09DRAFT_1085605 [Coniochaeta sp. 2T2.1]
MRCGTVEVARLLAQTASINRTRLCHFLLHFISRACHPQWQTSHGWDHQFNPIGNGLDAFRASFNTVCADKRIPYTPDVPGQLDLEDVQNLALDLLSALQSLRASRLLRPGGGSGKNLFSDLSRLSSAGNSDDFDLDRIKPLLRAALADHRDDALIWNRVYDAVTESTPPPDR